MSYLQAILLAVIQGLTEFLPISSSGHLVIFQKLFGLSEPPVVFDILVHVGTLGAVILFFRNRLVQILKGLARREGESWNIFLMVVIGTIPAVVVGLVLQNYIKQMFNSLELVKITLLVTAGLLFSVKFVKHLDRGFKYLNWQDAFFVGAFQALAILPGVSRSGATIVSGLWRRLDRQTAFCFSFYLAIPAIIGALTLQVPELTNSQFSYLDKGLLGMAIAGVVGYFALDLLEKFLRSAKFFYFGFYCAILGFSLLLL